jgi:hypothetical protein
MQEIRRCSQPDGIRGFPDPIGAEQLAQEFRRVAAPVEGCMIGSGSITVENGNTGTGTKCRQNGKRGSSVQWLTFMKGLPGAFTPGEARCRRY